MKGYLVAPEAEDDLRQIWRYLLGEAGLAIANRIQSELVDAFEGMADFPGKGHKRPDPHQPRCAVLQRVSIHDRVSARDVGGDRCRPSWQTRRKTAPQEPDVTMTQIRNAEERADLKDTFRTRLRSGRSLCR